MKKGLIIGIVIALVVIIAGVFVVVNSFAPDFNVNGTYKTEDGNTAVVSDGKVTFDSGEILEIKEKGFSFEYLKTSSDYDYKIYTATVDGKEEEFLIHNENGDIFFGYNDQTYTLEK